MTSEHKQVRWSKDENAAVMNEAHRLYEATQRMPSMADAQAILKKDRHHKVSEANERNFRTNYRKFFGAEGSAGLAGVAPPVREVPMTTEPWQAANVNELVEPDLEDKVIGFVVSIIDGICTHPAVINSVHRLVHSAFEKEAKDAIDKAAAWPEKTIASRLPRVLIAGLRPSNLEQERVQTQFGTTLALRFWNEDSQSKHDLKRSIHGCDHIIVIPSRVSHSAMAMIKARHKDKDGRSKAPLYAKGMGSTDVIKSLEYLAKEFIMVS